jgi:hypothetical protein
VEQEGLCEAQWTRELKSLKPSSSWLLRWFHGETDEKNVINFFGEKPGVCIVCNEK